MSEVRLIDANALEKTAIPCEIHNGALTELCVPLYQIRNAPTLPNPCGNPCNFVRPTGEWYYLKANEKQTDGYECSVCKATYHTRVPYFSEFNYCPNCGARMEADNE